MNALLAVVSRSIADPKPVKDAQQAEELAHILKTVRPHARLVPGAPRAGAARGGPLFGEAPPPLPAWAHPRAEWPSLPSAHCPGVPQIKWKNSLALWALPRALWAPLPLFLQSWLANGVLCYVEYGLSGALWALWVYKCASRASCGATRRPQERHSAALGGETRSWVLCSACGEQSPPPNTRADPRVSVSAGYPNPQLVGKHPSWEAMRAQVVVSCKAIPLYTLLPPLSEHLILSGYTRAYGRISSVGLPLYLCHVALYMLSVEFGVYWMHRKLHEVKWAYSWLHRIHHVYNKENTLSPFAGLAFHPLDGLLQAVPYVWTLFLTPCHYFTHELLLFFTGIWTANIHDCIDGDCEPIMGAAYHTIHHTTYRHNYGAPRPAPPPPGFKVALR